MPYLMIKLTIAISFEQLGPDCQEQCEQKSNIKYI